MNRRELLAGLLAAAARPDPSARDGLLQAVEGLLATSPERFWLQVVDATGPVYRRRRGFRPGEVVALGSVRKLFTAALALAVVDDGRLSLDDPAGRWLPAWDTPERQGVTLRRLLSHTAGLKKRPRNGFCAGLGSLGACVDKMAEAPLASAPGTEFRYSSAGFHVAARVLEVVAGEPFAALLQRRLLDPLGMASTTLRPAGPDAGDMTGELWSTPPDVAAFLRMVCGGGSFEGRRVLSGGAVDELVRRQFAEVTFVPGVPAVVWWPPGHGFYALGQWRNAEDAAGETLVTTAEGNSGDGWVITWVDRRVGRAGCVALGAPRKAREPFRALIEASCMDAGGAACDTTWGVLEGGDGADGAG